MAGVPKSRSRSRSSWAAGARGGAATASGAGRLPPPGTGRAAVAVAAASLQGLLHLTAGNQPEKLAEGELLRAELKKVRKRPAAQFSSPGGRVDSGAPAAIGQDSSSECVARDIATVALLKRQMKGHVAMRGLALVPVPLARLAGGEDWSEEQGVCAASRRPQRQRMQPLQAWRNERLVYGRPRGSPLPLVCGALLNAAGGPGRGPDRATSGLDLRANSRPRPALAALQDGAAYARTASGRRRSASS